jgi:hypothetical protein
MKHFSIFLFVFFASALALSAQDATGILKSIDRNLSADTRIIEYSMVIHGKRNDRSLTAKSYTAGNTKSYTEYFSPAREQGTKMLKLEKEMWIYSPSTDRTIMISGHMLRQSMMGSDLSYEDMMEDRPLTEMYEAVVTGSETLDGRDCWLLSLKAKADDVGYPAQKIWVDKLRNVPLQQELYAKSGQLLKKVNLSEIKQVEGRWFPMKMRYKDMLKDGEGTDWVISSISFNKQIPAHIFSKANLKK